MTKQEFQLLQQCAEILDREEKAFDKKQIPENEPYIYLLISDADDRIASLIVQIDKHPEYLSPFWSDKLRALVTSKQIVKHKPYTITYNCNQAGEHFLKIGNKHGGWNFGPYSHFHKMKEDITELKDTFGFQLIMSAELEKN